MSRAMQENEERGPDASSLPCQGLRVGAEADSGLVTAFDLFFEK